jgi:hypothetical protein
MFPKYQELESHLRPFRSTGYSVTHEIWVQSSQVCEKNTLFIFTLSSTLYVRL